MKIVPLKEGGESIPVTLENRREFVQLAAQYRLYSSIKDQLENLLSGFYDVIPKDLVSIVSFFTHPYLNYELTISLVLSSSTSKNWSSSSLERLRLTWTSGVQRRTTTATTPPTLSLSGGGAHSSPSTVTRGRKCSASRPGRRGFH